MRRNSELKKIINPAEGQLQTANDEHNPSADFVVSNFHMGSYRSDRIKALLAGKPKLDVDDFTSIQSDLLSLQADAFMKILRPLLPNAGNSAAAEVLRLWDCRYNADSRGAPIFEEFYADLLEDVYGRVLGAANWRHLWARLFLGVGFHYFDDVCELLLISLILTSLQLILAYSPALDQLLWHGESRNVLFSRVLKSVLAKHNHTSTNLQTWGALRKYSKKLLRFFVEAF
jgi:hypothetical protein